MATATRDTPVSNSYARALLQLANEKNQAEEVGRELRDLLGIVDSDPTFAAVIADPGVTTVTRSGLLERVFTGRLSPLLMNFLRVLNDKGRLGLLADIEMAYDEQLGVQTGKVEVDVTVAQPLTPDELEQVRRRVSQALGKEAVVHPHVDDSIIGGLILRVQDQLIDASVRYQLQAMKEQLLAARPK